MAEQYNESFRSEMSSSYESDSMLGLTAQSGSYKVDQHRDPLTEDPLRAREKGTGTSNAWSEVKALRNTVWHIFDRLEVIQEKDEGPYNHNEIFTSVKELKESCQKFWTYVEVCSEEVEFLEAAKQDLETSEKNLIERIKEIEAKGEESARAWKSKYENAVEELENAESALQDQDQKGSTSRPSRRPMRGHGHDHEESIRVRQLKEKLEQQELNQREADERWQERTVALTSGFAEVIEDYKEQCAQMATKTVELSSSLDLLREEFAELESQLAATTTEKDRIKDENDAYEKKHIELIQYILTVMEGMGNGKQGDPVSQMTEEVSPRPQLSLSDALRMFVTTTEDRLRALSHGRGDSSALRRLSPRHTTNAVTIQVPPAEDQPMPKPREIIKKVPVEVIVYRDVPVEVTKEVIVEVPVDRIVEVPVERIVEVPVDRIVEVPVDRIVEVPVERIVEVPVHTESLIDYSKLASALAEFKEGKGEGSVHLHFHEHGHEHAHRHSHTHNHVYGGGKVGSAVAIGVVGSAGEKSHTLTTGVHLKAKAKRTETACGAA